MPIGATSLQPFEPTTYTSMVASTYKADLDGNSAILSNAGGALYVYPANPAAMSVLVDPAFNLPQQGAASPFLLNGSASAATVSLTAPGSNSYYATIYWNASTNAAGVVYGAPSATPVPILPDDAAQEPLALVLLTNGQVNVQASNIYDVRSWFPRGPVRAYNATGNSFTFFCMGASSIDIDWTVATNVTLAFSGLQVGIPFQINITNSSGTTRAITLSATTPGGVSYSVLTKIAGNAVALSAPPFNLQSGDSWVVEGITSYRGSTPYLIASLQ
jgi:hypothetical protein